MFNRLSSYLKGVGNKFYSKEKWINTKDILYLYRYLSWFFTSLFYLFTQLNAPIVLKVGVIVTLFGAAKILTDLYIKFSNSHRILEIAILVETIGITLLIIPTGGLHSPFIWYALNPVLVAASFLPLYFCWVNPIILPHICFYYLLRFFRHVKNISDLIIDNEYLYYYLCYYFNSTDAISPIKD